MEEILSNQKKAYIKEGEVSAATRVDRIDRAIDILANNGPKLCEAMAADFGHRSLEQSKLTDIDGSIGPLKDDQEDRHVDRKQKRNCGEIARLNIAI